MHPINETLQQFIQKQLANVRQRFCMPGHKGTLNPLDVTETGDMDNLHQPHGALLAAHERCAKAYGAQAAHFCVNGSTGGVIAMLCSLALEGKTVLLGADCHVSAVSALIHSAALPHMLPPNYRKDGVPLPCAAKDVAQALDGEDDIAAVFVTSPNYYGFCADIPSIAGLCHQKGIPLLVDAAHGAHFGFSSNLPPQPVLADAWVVSAHKTLSVPNQGALLFLGEGSLLKERRLWDALNSVQTTSPSWPLLCAMDDAITGLCQHGETDYAALLSRIRNFEHLLHDTPFEVVSQELPFRDPTRLVLSTERKGLSGFDAARFLQARGILVEMADLCHLNLICTPLDKEEDFLCLYKALLAMPQGDGNPRPLPAPPHGQLFISPRSAAYGTMELCDLSFSAGRVAARAILCYPPGVAVVLPGQKITREQIAYLLAMDRAGASLMHVDNGCIRVLPQNA